MALSEPKQMQRAVEAFVLDVGDAMRDVVRRLPDIDGRKIDQDVATEAFNLVTALIDIDRRHTDGELWGVIFSFWRLMPGELGEAKADDLRRSDLLVGRASWLTTVSPMLEILTTADRRFGSAHARTYYDRALHLAFTVAALDASPSRPELQAIDDLRNLMLAALSGLPSSPLAPRVPTAEPGVAAAAGAEAAAEPEAAELPPVRPIEEML
ncbi:MAG: hypothetical protein ABIP03_12970, partial [Aquihabitans sp.]